MKDIWNSRDTHCIFSHRILFSYSESDQIERSHRNDLDFVIEAHVGVSCCAYLCRIVSWISWIKLIKFREIPVAGTQFKIGTIAADSIWLSNGGAAQKEDIIAINIIRMYVRKHTKSNHKQSGRKKTKEKHFQVVGYLRQSRFKCRWRWRLFFGIH